MKVRFFAQTKGRFHYLRFAVANLVSEFDQPWIPPNKLPINSLGRMEALLRGTIDQQLLPDLIIIDRGGFPQNLSPQEGFEVLQWALPDLRKNPPAVIYLQETSVSLKPEVVAALLTQRIRYFQWSSNVPFEEIGEELHRCILELIRPQSLEPITTVTKKIEQRESICT